MIERIEINLLPSEYRIRKRSVAVPRSVIYPAVALIGLILIAGVVTITGKDKESRLNDEIAVINREIEANKGLQQELNELRETKRVTEGKIAGLKQISVDREKWVRLLEMLSSALPSYTWLISVKEEAEPVERLAIEARTYSFPEVAHYMSRLEAHELVDNVGLVGVEQIQGQDRKMYKFNLICVLASATNRTPPAEQEPAEDAGGRRGRRGR